MKRFELLQQAAQEKTSEVSLKKLVGTELRNFKKVISDLEFEIENKKEKVEERLSNPTEMGKSDVIGLYADLKNVKAQKDLISDFVKEFYEG